MFRHFRIGDDTITPPPKKCPKWTDIIYVIAEDKPLLATINTPKVSFSSAVKCSCFGSLNPNKSTCRIQETEWGQRMHYAAGWWLVVAWVLHGFLGRTYSYCRYRIQDIISCGKKRTLMRWIWFQNISITQNETLRIPLDRLSAAFGSSTALIILRQTVCTLTVLRS